MPRLLHRACSLHVGYRGSFLGLVSPVYLPARLRVATGPERGSFRQASPRVERRDRGKGDLQIVNTSAALLAACAAPE